MNWLIISILPPMIWALTNHVDKFLLNKYFKNANAGALIILTSLTSLLALPLILFFSTAKIDIGVQNILILIGLSLLGMIAGLLYIYALNKGILVLLFPYFK